MALSQNSSPERPPSASRQSRAMSFAEAILNVVIGFVLAMATQIGVFPLLGVHVPVATNLVIGSVFTAVSIARSYLLRRFFEALRSRMPDRGGSAIQP